MTTGRRRGLAAALVVLLLGSACTDGTDDPTAPSPQEDSPPIGQPSTDADDRGTLRFALGSDPASIDPRFISDDEGALVVDALFDSLVALDDDLVAVPAAATSWTIDEARRLYTFELRDDATFHDGTPVTASDFVRSFQRIADGTAEPPSFLFYQLAAVVGFDEARTAGTPLAGVRATAEHTLEIELTEPFEDFLYVLADPSLAPVPPVADEDPARFRERPVGNGPFAMASDWQHNQFIRVVAYAEHTTPPRLNEVVFQIFADDAARDQQYDDFQRGLVDVAEIPASALATARQEHGRSDDGYSGPGVLDGVTGTVYYLGFNTQQPPLDDPAVRRALSMLIDRDGIVEDIMLDVRVVARGLVPPSVPGAAVDACSHCLYNPEAARAALTAEDGTILGGLEGPLRIFHNTGTTNRRIADRIARDVEAALGIEVEVTSADLEPFVEQVRAGDVDLFRIGWQAEYPSPGSVLLPLFRTAAIGQDNLTRYSDPEVDALLEQARTTVDRTERFDLYRQAEGRILEAAPVAPIFFYRHSRVVADTVAGFQLGPFGNVDLTQVQMSR